MAKRKKRARRRHTPATPPTSGNAQQSAPEAAPVAQKSPERDAPPPAPRGPRGPTETIFIRGDLPKTQQSIFTALVVFLIAAAPLTAPYGQSAFGYAPDLHITSFTQVLGLLILTLFAFACLRQTRLLIPRTPILAPISLLFAWGALSLFWTTGIYDAMLEASDWLGGFLVLLLTLLVMRGRERQNQLLLAIGVCGFLVGLYGVLQHLTNSHLGVLQSAKPASTLGNKNMFSQFMIMTAPVVIALFLRSTKPVQTWLFAVMAGLMTGAIIYAASRGAFLALTAQAALWVALLAYLRLRHGFNPFKTMDKKIAVAVLVLIPVAMGMLNAPKGAKQTPVAPAVETMKPLAEDADAGDAPPEPVAATGEAGDAEASALRRAWRAIEDRLPLSGRIRITMWGNSVHMWRDHWLIGVGIGNWRTLYPIYQAAWRPDIKLRGHYFHPHAHNDTVEILCELGVVGFAFYLWLLVGIARLILRTLASFTDNEKSNSVYMLGPVIALMGISVSSMSSFPFKQPATLLLIGAYLALLSLHYSAVRGGRAWTLNITNRPAKTGAVVVALLVTGAGVTLHYSWYQADLYRREASALLSQNKYEKVWDAAEKMYAFSPQNPAANWFRATALLATGRPEPAVTLFDEVLKQRPYMISAMTNKELALTTLKRPGEAAKVVAEMLEVQPARGRWFKRAEYLQQSGRHDEALEIYDYLVESALPMLDTCAGGVPFDCAYVRGKIRKAESKRAKALKRAEQSAQRDAPDDDDERTPPDAPAP